MSSPRNVKQVAQETGWLNEKFLKHLAKNYSGKEFTLDSLREDPVISKFLVPSKTAPKKKGSRRPAAEVAPSPMKFLKENPDTAIQFIQENPKKSGSQSYTLYEKYKVAKTYAEFKSLGGENNFLLWDYRKGFLQIEGADIENFTPAPKKKQAAKKVAKKTSKKESNPIQKKEKKKAEKKVEKKAEKKAEAEEKAEEKVEDEPAPVTGELDEDETQVDQVDEEATQEPTETPVESHNSDDSDESDEEEGNFNPFNITADESDDGEESD